MERHIEQIERVFHCMFVGNGINAALHLEASEREKKQTREVNANSDCVPVAWNSQRQIFFFLANNRIVKMSTHEIMRCSENKVFNFKIIGKL